MSVHFASAGEGEDYPFPAPVAHLPIDDVSYNSLRPHFAGDRTADDFLELLILHAGLTVGIGRFRQAENPAPLGIEDRQRRIRELLRLWASGCKHAIDERLYSDIAAKRPDDLATLRAGLRKGK